MRQFEICELLKLIIINQDFVPNNSKLLKGARSAFCGYLDKVENSFTVFSILKSDFFFFFFFVILIFREEGEGSIQ